MRTKDVTVPRWPESLWLMLFPARCLSCGCVLPPDGFFCRACRASAQPPEPRRFRLGESGKELEARAAALYRGGFRDTLHRYKFNGERGLAGQLGRLAAGQAQGFSRDFDGVTYVPLSPKRRRARGYDQSALLARSIAKALGLPLLPLLQKTRDNQTQHTLGRAARWENVKGVYQAAPQSAGLALLLVDDIVTTGATLCQCAEALYAQGAGSVCALCAASAQKKD